MQNINSISCIMSIVIKIKKKKVQKKIIIYYVYIFIETKLQNLSYAMKSCIKLCVDAIMQRQNTPYKHILTLYTHT